jgi:hypothetical protein
MTKSAKHQKTRSTLIELLPRDNFDQKSCIDIELIRIVLQPLQQLAQIFFVMVDCARNNCAHLRTLCAIIKVGIFNAQV